MSLFFCRWLKALLSKVLSCFLFVIHAVVGHVVMLVLSIFTHSSEVLYICRHFWVGRQRWNQLHIHCSWVTALHNILYGGGNSNAVVFLQSMLFLPEFYTTFHWLLDFLEWVQVNKKVFFQEIANFSTTLLNAGLLIILCFSCRENMTYASGNDVQLCVNSLGLILNCPFLPDVLPFRWLITLQCYAYVV